MLSSWLNLTIGDFEHSQSRMLWVGVTSFDLPPAPLPWEPSAKSEIHNTCIAAARLLGRHRTWHDLNPWGKSRSSPAHFALAAKSNPRNLWAAQCKEWTHLVILITFSLVSLHLFIKRWIFIIINFVSRSKHVSVGGTA